MSKSEYRRKIIEQRFYGVCIMIVSVVIILIACTGNSVEDRDATAVLLTAPLGIYMLFAKEVVIV